MSDYIYDIVCSVNLGKLSPEINSIMESLNNEISSFGIEEHLIVRSKVMRMKLTSGQLLNQQQRKGIMKILESVGANLQLKVESFRRKPCNESRNNSEQ